MKLIEISKYLINGDKILYVDPCFKHSKYSIDIYLEENKIVTIPCDDSNKREEYMKYLKYSS